MSDTYPSYPTPSEEPYGASAQSGDSSPEAGKKAGEVKDAAAGVAQSAGDAAKGVASTAKDEAASVVDETKAQAADFFHTARRELSDQAATQQERAAAGLGSIGDELASMADKSDNGGVAADLVRRASEKASSMAQWLGNRDPNGVLDDVKAFARRRPGVFIGGALIAGIVAGRLTRAMIANAQDEHHESSGTSSASRPGSSSGTRRSAVDASGYVQSDAVDATLYTGTDAVDPPLYAESAARLGEVGDVGEGGISDERPYTV